jgi:hypothetical protein
MIFLEDLGLTWEQRAPLLLRPAVQGEVAPRRLAHLSAREYVENKYVPQELFDAYFRFAMVRDPFRRLESLYTFWGLNSRLSFSQFITSYLPRILQDPNHEDRFFFRSQAEFLTNDHGGLLVDELVRLERIDEDLPPVLQRVGISVDKAPHINRSAARPANRTARSLLGLRRRGHGRSWPVEWSPDLQERVVELYRSDFTLLAYPEDRARVAVGAAPPPQTSPSQ